MVHVHTSISEHVLKIAVADWELKIPADCPQMISAVNCRPLNGFLLPCITVSPSQPHPVVAQAGQASKLQQNRSPASSSGQPEVCPLTCPAY
jgi:hypothetical protein